MAKREYCILFHNWGKWKQEEEPRFYVTQPKVIWTQLVQTRYCKVCNKMQKRDINP